jgi:hypothetical protein
MPLPWLRIVDGVLGATDLVRWARGGSGDEHVAGSSRLEARLAAVVVSALKEVFDRDHQRVEFERQRLEEERERADRLIRLEWLRQAGEREIARLRLLAGVILAVWFGSLFLVSRLAAAGVLQRVTLGLAWCLLVGALAASFSAQSRIARAVGEMDDRSSVGEVTTSAAAAVSLWLTVAAFVTVAISVLIG